MNDFKIFYDKELQKPAGEFIELGKQKAGYSKKYTFYVYNTSVSPYEELKFSVDSAEVRVVSAPEELEEKRSAELILEWKPRVDIKKGLKTQLKIEGYQVIS